jgi:hypothetical protein
MILLDDLYWQLLNVISLFGLLGKLCSKEFLSTELRCWEAD